MTGTFGSATSLAILTPRLYGPNSVSVEIRRVFIAMWADHGAGRLCLQRQSRSNTGLAGVYGPLDLQNAATIRATLILGFCTETLRGSLATVAADNMSAIAIACSSSIGDMGGTLAMIGRPVHWRIST